MCWARLGPTGYSGPAGLFLSVSICKKPVVLSVCFPHHKCSVGRVPRVVEAMVEERPGLCLKKIKKNKKNKTSGYGCQAEEPGQQMLLLLQPYLRKCSHQDSHACDQNPWQDPDFCQQHTLTRHAWQNCPGIPVSHMSLRRLFSLPTHPPLRSRSLGILVSVKLALVTPRQCPEAYGHPQCK